MASVKKIETTVGAVQVETVRDGECAVCLIHADGSVTSVNMDENDLITAVLEYAHERGLRRMRKTPQTAVSKPRKTRKVKPVMVPPEHPGPAPALSDPLAGTPAAFAQ